MSFDFDQYGDEPTQTSALSTETNQPNSPVALAILGLGAAALLGSGATALPGVVQNFQTAAMVQQQRDRNGLRILSRDEAEKLVVDAIPLLDENGKLLPLGWEDVRNDPNRKGGTYIVRTGVFYKATVGAGSQGSIPAATGHSYGDLPPKVLARRVEQYLRETKGGL
jgi:hypothetical protein